MFGRVLNTRLKRTIIIYGQKFNFRKSIIRLDVKIYFQYTQFDSGRKIRTNLCSGSKVLAAIRLKIIFLILKKIIFFKEKKENSYKYH